MNGDAFYIHRSGKCFSQYCIAQNCVSPNWTFAHNCIFYLEHPTSVDLKNLILLNIKSTEALI
jgi:hypothetical protein